MMKSTSSQWDETESPIQQGWRMGLISRATHVLASLLWATTYHFYMDTLPCSCVPLYNTKIILSLSRTLLAMDYDVKPSWKSRCFKDSFLYVSLDEWSYLASFNFSTMWARASPHPRPALHIFIQFMYLSCHEKNEKVQAKYLLKR